MSCFSEPSNQDFAGYEQSRAPLWACQCRHALRLAALCDLKNQREIIFMIETPQDVSSVLNASEVYFCSTGASVLIRADGTGSSPHSIWFGVIRPNGL